MRKFMCIFSLALALPVAAHADVFRWVDDDGQVHYSDRPHEGAETVNLAPAQTFTAPQVAARATPADDAAAPFEYKSIAISKPGQEETIWNTANSVDVSLSVSPRLRRGDNIRWYLDGQLQSSLPRRAMSASIPAVWRGTHQLVAEVQDMNGNTVARSNPVTFEYKATNPLGPKSPLNPGNPNNPPIPSPGLR